jgi:integrase/recombinase XerC
VSSEVFNRYIGYLEAEKNASRYTVRNYKNDLLEFFGFIMSGGITTLRDVNKQTLRAYLAFLMKKGTAKSSIARRLSAIRSFYRYLQREELLTANPAATTVSPKLDKRLPSFLTVDEANQLMESPSLPQHPREISGLVLSRNIAMLELLYASGIRVSELMSLNIEQVDLPGKELRVWGKGSKERIVLIGAPAARALDEYMNKARPLLLGDKKNNALFVSRYGERLLARRAQKLLKQWSATINKNVHPHVLRHTFATHLLDGGADLKVVQELLGHADLSSTQIYTHVTQTRARKIYLAAHPLAQGDGRE